MRILLGWAVKNNDARLKIHPVLFRGLAGHFSVYLESLLIFGTTSQLSKINIVGQNLDRQ